MKLWLRELICNPWWNRKVKPHQNGVSGNGECYVYTALFNSLKAVKKILRVAWKLFNLFYIFLDVRVLYSMSMNFLGRLEILGAIDYRLVCKVICCYCRKCITEMSLVPIYHCVWNHASFLNYAKYAALGLCEPFCLHEMAKGLCETSWNAVAFAVGRSNLMMRKLPH